MYPALNMACILVRGGGTFPFGSILGVQALGYFVRPIHRNTRCGILPRQRRAFVSAGAAVGDARVNASRLNQYFLSPATRSPHQAWQPTPIAALNIVQRRETTNTSSVTGCLLSDPLSGSLTTSCHDKNGDFESSARHVFVTPGVKGDTKPAPSCPRPNPTKRSTATESNQNDENKQDLEDTEYGGGGSKRARGRGRYRSRPPPSCRRRCPRLCT